MEYIPRGELFAAWSACDCFGENLVRLYITELAMVLGKDREIPQEEGAGGVFLP